MSISARQEQILKIINERTYVTVNELSKLTFTSESSIRRDLTRMQNSGLVKRSYGGVSLPEPINGVASFFARTQKNIKEKRVIACKAASLLKNGQSIILDSSSTASFLLPYIAKLEGVSIFTNNLSTAVNAIGLGIDTHCLGGHAKAGELVLAGAQTYKALSEINADILFFSSQSIDLGGNITDSTESENFARTLMMKSAKVKVFLCDSEKFGKSSVYRLAHVDDVDFAVFDKEFPGLETTTQIL